MTKTAKAPRPYYVLATNEDGAGWGVEFGDYDRETVEDERDDYCCGGIPKRCTKIIVTGETQADIDAAIAKLNAN